jgi:hypothetical protein
LQTRQDGRTICCIGTGPSVTPQQVETARRKGFVLYACNDAYRLAPDCALLHACNWQWWDARWDEVKGLPCEKWTTRKEAAAKYPINWIDEQDGKGRGLSREPQLYLHHGHGSGYQLLGMAHRAGARRVVLLGYDLKYAPDYNGTMRRIGSGPRHFFGEYPPELQHWPKVAVRDGVHFEMIRIYNETAKYLSETGPAEVINCSPGSALTAFPMMDIADVSDGD